MSHDRSSQIRRKHIPEPQPLIPEPGSKITLCFPDSNKSCFACCPPIRPAHYEHIQYKNIIKRVLRENTSAFTRGGQGVRPITGMSCWALGYLDKECKLIGCLLHPGRNRGKDLRYRVGFGEKCSREICPEAREFLKLEKEPRRFWLQLTDGLDSFSYSSRKVNPLFKMLGWGAELLAEIARAEGGVSLSRDSFSLSYPFFSTPLNPKAHAYIIESMVKRKGTGLLRWQGFRQRFEVFSRYLLVSLEKNFSYCPDAPHTHRLDLDRRFLDYLRLAAGITRIDVAAALKMKEIVDREVVKFLETGGFNAPW